MQVLPNVDLDRLDRAYAEGRPEVSDAEYDALVANLQDKRPPGDHARGSAVALPFWMGSLDKASPGSVAARVAKRAAGGHCVSEKLDGVSCMYHGPTDRLLTRGDGETGHDVTRLRHAGLGIPTGLPAVVVRGELVVSRSDFERRFSAGSGAGAAANARNLVAGVVNAKSPNAAVLAAVRFVAYELVTPAGRPPSSQFAEMSAMGFEVARHWRVSGTPDAESLTAVLAASKAASAYDVDGLVVAEDRRYSRTSRGNPSHAFAYKDPGLQDHDEINNVKKILGLEAGKEYASVDELRYGRVLILADQDVDGSHIKGLLLNVFSALWPSLFAMPEFLASMATPIVKVRRGAQERVFYTLPEYDEWRAEADRSGWSTKYYKGLGTSTAAEARDYFRAMRCVDFAADAQSADAMDLAFNKKRADDRKRWLEAYDRSDVPRGDGTGSMTHRAFVDRELIHFSNYDLERSIPHAVDGLKTSQRKILYACFKRGLTSEVRVAQLAGYVSEHAGYHHGETSLNGAIVCLAQDFVGSNNVNLLRPNGQFGTRLQGGKDAASARYIYTELAAVTGALIRAEDAPVLEYREDDGARVEPEHYVPVAPVVLLNGCSGIGTGFSTSVPAYDPLEVVANTRRAARGEPTTPMTPWTRGFTGEVAADPESGRVWRTSGTARRASPQVLEITELPVGTWTQNYKEFLDDQVGKPGGPRDVTSQCTDTAVRFTVRYASAADAEAALEASAKTLRLETAHKSMRTTNMHLYGPEGRVRRYDDVDAVFRDHAAVRAATYVARKAHQVAELEAVVERVTAKARFTAAVAAGELELLGRAKADLEAALAEDGYPALAERSDLGSAAGYDYLLSMPVASLTKERVARLEADAAARAAELATLVATEPIDIWMRELDELEARLKSIRTVVQASP